MGVMIILLYRHILLIVFAVSISGCSTMMNDHYQGVPVTSDPSRACAVVDEKMTAFTPTIFNLERKKDHVIEISKEGYRTAKFILKHSLSGAMLGNIFVGGVVGAAVDGCAGSGFKLTPEEIHAKLEKI